MKPGWVDRVNYLGEMLGGAERALALDADELTMLAVETTGLDDFGEGFGEQKLKRWVAIADGRRLNLLGRALEKANIVRLLQNRLMVTDLIKKNPAILAEKIESPVIVTGNGRTGTTILFELLSLNNIFRVPLAWEVDYPAGFPSQLKKPKFGCIGAAESFNDLLMDIQPSIKPMHEIGAILPAECWKIMEMNFDNGVISEDVKKDSAVWRLERYQWHKKVLQVLQHNKPKKRWVLKCPWHQGFVDEVFTVYPDAEIINTFRDPVKSVASLIKLNDLWVRATCDEVVGGNGALVEVLRQACMCLIEKRKSSSLVDSKIYDVDYLSFIGDPCRMIGDIHGHLGVDLCKDFNGKSIEFFNRKRTKKYTYNLCDYGFSSGKIREIFKDYIDFYGVRLEG